MDSKRDRSGLLFGVAELHPEHVSKRQDRDHQPEDWIAQDVDEFQHPPNATHRKLLS